MKTFISIIILILTITTIGLCQEVSTGECYFDNATGHKYVLLSNGDYQEYTRKGDPFKVVHPNQLRLNKLPLVTPNHVIIYKRWIDGKQVIKTLPAHLPHPEGWKAYTTLII